MAIQDWRDPRLALHLGEATLVRKVPPPFVRFVSARNIKGSLNWTHFWGNQIIYRQHIYYYYVA